MHIQTGTDRQHTAISDGILAEDWAEYRELQYCLHQAVQTLPVKARAVVLLRYEGDIESQNWHFQEPVADIGS